MTSSHSKSEYKNLSAAVKQKFAQHGRANRHASVGADSRSDERQCSRETSMARAAHKLGICFLHGSYDGPDEYLLPLLVAEKSDDGRTRQMWSDVSAAKQVDPSAFKPDVQIEPPEEVPVGSKFLNKSDGAQVVGRRLGVGRAAGSVVAEGQATARGQRVWLNCDDEFILDGESASVAEESLGDNRGFSESRDQKRACAVCHKEQSSSSFPTGEQESSPWMQMDRGEVEVAEARLTTDKEKDEYEAMRTVLRNWCNSCVRGRAKHSHRCPTCDPSRSLMAKDCRVSLRSVSENSPQYWSCLRTHGVERDCQASREATEPHAVDCVFFKGDSESAAQVPIDEMEVERSEEAAAEESPKCLYQSSGEAEDTVQRIEGLTRFRACVLREKLGRKVDSKSVASSRPD